MAAFAEPAARSNFSFLDGASHPAELVQTAAALGLAGLGLCDLNSLAGVVRGHVAAKECVSAWKKDPLEGVIGVQSGPPC